MNTLKIILVWVGVGASVGVGFVAAVTVAWKLSELLEKLCPRSSKSNINQKKKDDTHRVIFENKNKGEN